MNGAALEHRGGGAGRGAGWRRGAAGRASLRGAARLGGGGVLPSSGSGAARGGAGRCGRSGRPAAAAACLQRAAGRALINALVNGKRCRARLLAPPACPAPPPPGWVGRNLRRALTCGCGGSAMGRCVSLTGSCLGRNLPRYFNLERREICAGGLFLSLPPPSTLN